MKETLPQRLVRFRDERGLSQDQAAELAGISRVSITRYENGTREPKYKNLLAIAKAYGLTLEELTGEEKPIPEDELDKELIQMLSKLSERESDKVRSFVEGMLASRKE